MANGELVQIKYSPIQRYGPIKLLYIKMQYINESIKLGDWIEAGTPLGRIGDNTQI